MRRKIDFRFDGDDTSVALIEEKLADGISDFVLTYYRLPPGIGGPAEGRLPVHSERFRDGMDLAIDRYQIARTAILVCEGDRDG